MKSIRKFSLQYITVLALAMMIPSAFAAPTITAISPATAPVGSLVTISGSGFGTTQGTSTVTFNGIAATVMALDWHDTSITATVPSGAVSGNVVVTVGGASSNGKAFTVGLDINVKRILNVGQAPPADPGRLQTSNVTVWVNFPPGTASVGLKFTSPDTFTNAADKTWSVTIPPATLPTCPFDATAVACHDFAVPSDVVARCPAACKDNITIVPHPPSDAAGALQFEIRFSLFSNYNVAPAAGQTLCSGTQSQAPEDYTIEVTTGTALTGACVESFDRKKTNCTATNVITERLLAPGEVFVNGFALPTDQCGPQRPELAVVMSLDKSGSMDASLTPPPGAFCSSADNTREKALKCSADHFLDLWKALTPAKANDSVGIVSFSTAATSPPEAALGLLTVVPTFAISPSGSTSVGAGLHAADNMVGASSIVRKAILLMTDGQQNTDPKVEVTNSTTRKAGLYCDNPTDPLCVIPSTCTVGSPCPLSSNAQVYTVTLGPSLGVSAAIDQAISQSSLGFYLHTDTDGNLLSPFFLELLQNFLKFNSYDTVRLISDRVSATSYATNVPISGTSRDIELSLMWPKDFGPLRLVVTPPGGGPAITKEDNSGFLTVVQPLPLPAPFTPGENWHVEVQLGSLAAGTVARIGNRTIPFDLHIMTDDAGVKSDLSVVPGDYKVGGEIRLQAKLKYFGLPILGIGSLPGDKIFATPIAPGQGVGDFLSESTASSSPPAGTDFAPGAESKLFNATQSSSIGVYPQPNITLYDDGKSEHGDDVAGDGIYSGIFHATTMGDYNFVISVERTDAQAGRFARQQLRAANVRAVPDTDNTVIQSSILRRDKGGVLSMVMTPRVKPGPNCLKSNPKCGRMGPGWANYFWFTAPGQTPFKATDNLDGTYTATLAFTGATPPPVSVHFEDVLAIIGDSVTPDHLPQPLDSGNTFAHVPPGGGATSGKFALFLDAGAGIPHGTFSNAANTGFSFNAGLEYIATSHFSVEGIFGYHHFPGAVAGDVNLYQFSANGKVYLTNGNFRPFVNGGVGGYKFGSASTYVGGNFGGGFLHSFNSRFGVQGSYNFHVVNTPGSATKFSTIQGGIRWVF
jgi:hypothetical protein